MSTATWRRKFSRNQKPCFHCIRAATLVGARVLGEEARLGTIEVGKLADLIVLEKDPTESILNTRTIVFVMKGGTIFKPLDEDR